MCQVSQLTVLHIGWGGGEGIGAGRKLGPPEREQLVHCTASWLLDSVSALQLRVGTVLLSGCPAMVRCLRAPGGEQGLLTSCRPGAQDQPCVMQSLQDSPVE